MGEKVEVTATLPIINDGVTQIKPHAILDCHMGKHCNRMVAGVLIQWSNAPPEDPTQQVQTTKLFHWFSKP